MVITGASNTTASLIVKLSAHPFTFALELCADRGKLDFI
jgi:hypothetical protein